MQLIRRKCFNDFVDGIHELIKNSSPEIKELFVRKEFGKIDYSSVSNNYSFILFANSDNLKAIIEAKCGRYVTDVLFRKDLWNQYVGNLVSDIRNVGLTKVDYIEGLTIEFFVFSLDAFLVVLEDFFNYFRKSNYIEVKGRIIESLVDNLPIDQGNPLMEGIKHDQDKLDYTLLPFDSLEQVVKVLEYGAKKYARNNWQKVSKEGYVQAIYRHLIAYSKGEVLDDETGLSHMAHLACSALFILHLDNAKEN